jgi:hypothetical protein
VFLEGEAEEEAEPECQSERRRNGQDVSHQERLASSPKSSREEQR